MSKHEAAGAERRPTTEHIREELGRILAADLFEHAGRAKEFLLFVVEETLAGRGDRLKGYTIATGVFGRPADFDPHSDPLVRVEAGRLRRRLGEYYVGEGRENPMRIELPRGTYSPEFAYVMAAERGGHAPPWLRRGYSLASAAGGAMMLGLVVLAATVARQSTPPGMQPATPESQVTVAAAPGGPELLVLPFANLSSARDFEYFAYGMTEEVILRLHEFHLRVIADEPGLDARRRLRDLGALRAKFGTDYVLIGSVRHAGDRVRVMARLVDASTGAQLWTVAFDEQLDVDALITIQEHIAQRVAESIAVPYGPIFEREIARTARKAPEHVATYDCTLKFYYYGATLDHAAHTDALACFRRAVVREPQFADAWGGLALIYLAEHAYGYNPQPGDPIGRAREAARTALDIDGDNRFANRAMLSVRFATRDFTGLEDSADRTLVLSPNDPGTLALAGTFFALSGQWDRGLPLLDKALALSPRPPAWYYLAHALAGIREHDYDRALSWALKMDAPNWFMAPMLVAAAAALSGDAQLAERSAVRLLELYGEFPRYARQELAKWNLDEDLAATIIDGLRAAELPID